MINDIEWNVSQNVQQKQQPKQQNHQNVSFDTFLTNAIAPTQENGGASFKGKEITVVIYTVEGGFL